VTTLPGNRTATRTSSSVSSLFLYTTTPWIANATKTEFSAALYTGSAMSDWPQCASMIVSGALFAFGWVVM
jgi:hypothetical protein